MKFPEWFFAHKTLAAPPLSQALEKYYQIGFASPQQARSGENLHLHLQRLCILHDLRKRREPYMFQKVGYIFVIINNNNIICINTLWMIIYDQQKLCSKQQQPFTVYMLSAIMCILVVMYYSIIHITVCTLPNTIVNNHIIRIKNIVVLIIYSASVLKQAAFY